MNELRTFARIVTEGSLTRAAREMGLSLSMVSKRLATLEARTRTRLIARSTRRMTLTNEGARLFERVQRILAEVGEAEAMLAQGEIEPHGLLRIGAPVALGRAHVAPICQMLAEHHKDIEVELLLSDELNSLIDNGLDAVIRIGAPREPGLIVRKLADNHRVIVASPIYLERHGIPHEPAMLHRHDCLHTGARTTWRLEGPQGELEDIEITSRLRSNNGELWHDWALSGFGLAFKSWIDVAQDVRDGRLVQVLPRWRSPPAPICALFHARTLVPTRLRVFLEAMVTHFQSVRDIRAET